MARDRQGAGLPVRGGASSCGGSRWALRHQGMILPLGHAALLGFLGRLGRQQNNFVCTARSIPGWITFDARQTTRPHANEPAVCGGQPDTHGALPSTAVSPPSILCQVYPLCVLVASESRLVVDFAFDDEFVVVCTSIGRKWPFGA